ncbi:3-methyl-2-oxobutanoate hydroxymethyltransferase [Spirulina sp. 06S082]|uniref:3-methyl-2-oxobutanoate hydroxymethyltransferase n=1 Tax=Spirulina sp. 06S082 TaxID=3110248 RepID=UPI002B2058C7|nr:3-methyl-2-oxobutanoate hydroxymethyltransferase [Spirulina sp. 06S082]MEA5469433.1 3-methyl-2-oxobutanoate hydroxymethyltransferase [Spirulina sp. 06S082]
MPVTTRQLIEWKQQGRTIVALTAWDYAIAGLLDDAGIDIILVGDSLAMVALGYENTLPVTLDEMLHHTAAVCRGTKRALVVCDLPFLSYQESIEVAIRSAGRALKEAGAQAVKVEGASPDILATIRKLTAIGIPVMGHVGLTPQSVYQLGYKQQGTTEEQGQQILRDAIAVAEVGAFSLILEHIPSELAAQITAQLPIPTIGIGAGVQCDGQVLVTADLLGLSKKQPPFAKTYLNLRQMATQAVGEFINEVREQKFPR